MSHHQHNGTRLAAVDLGSNSFRLEISRLDHGQFERVQYIKEPIRQGGALDSERNLSADAMQRGWDCLARFGERLAGFQPSQVRAVATQTLREARNRDSFLHQASQVLGFPIEVISGREEARLIYLGVARLLPPTDERRLVIDIGGRSTELILGTRLEPTRLESYPVGCVAWSHRYFPAGQFSSRAMQLAQIAAKAVLDETLDAYQRTNWDMAFGSSGTVGAVADILAAAGEPPGRITSGGLDWLVEQLLEAQSADRLRLMGMKEDRRPVIGGGVAILRAIFDLLQIETMDAAAGSLRHGLLCELAGADEADARDLRSISVQRLATKFATDLSQGERVGRAATRLFQLALPGVADDTAGPQGDRELRQLAWAAQLHEIGAQISHSDAHKHGAYILENADAMGFTQGELHRLGLLVLGQRGKLRKVEADFDDALFVLQLLAMRLAIILCHARREPDITGMRLRRQERGGRGFLLECRPGWSQAFPQSAHLLREEVLAWQKAPWSLTVHGL